MLGLGLELKRGLTSTISLLVAACGSVPSEALVSGPVPTVTSTGSGKVKLGTLDGHFSTLAS